MYKMMLGLAAGLTLLSGAAMADGSRGKAASCCDAARPWTGFYIGIGAGAGSVVHDVSLDGFIGLQRHRRRGSVRHGCGRLRSQLTSRIVGGIFADYEFASNVSTDFSIGPIGLSIDQKNTWSIGGRLGVLSSPTTLWYGTARLHADRVRPEGSRSSSPDFKGYFVGAGVESQLVGGWNLRAEYRFSQFDSETVLSKT